MAAIQHGLKTGFIIQPGGTVSQDPDGSATANLTYKGPKALVYGNLPAPLQPHPSFPSLLLFTFVLSTEEGDVASCSCVYKGILVSNPAAYTQQDYVLSQTSEPIETNVAFSFPRDTPPVSSTELAAIQKALDQNVVYTSSNAAAQLLYDKKIRGIESYLRIGGAFSQRYVRGVIPIIPSGVGKIASSLPSGCPSPTAQGANYLYSGFSWSKAGGLVQVKEDYTQSGPSGWDPDLY